MRSLVTYILEGAGHNLLRVGSGSSGTVYDIGNGKLRKTFRVSLNSTHRKNDAEMLDKWSKASRKHADLRVIPYIEDADYDGYTIDKLETPCTEGTDIENALNHILYTPLRDAWKPAQIDKLKATYGEVGAQFLMQWFDDFVHDYRLILGEHAKIEDDIRAVNIGKDKEGHVKIFDWMDPYIA